MSVAGEGEARNAHSITHSPVGANVTVVTGGWETRVLVLSTVAVDVTVEVTVVCFLYLVSTVYNFDSAVKKSVTVEVGAVT